MDNRNILHAWEKFVENGTSPGAVRGIVAASWSRLDAARHDWRRKRTWFSIVLRMRT